MNATIPTFQCELNLLDASKSFRPSTPEATHKIVRRIRAESMPAIRTNTLCLLLCLVDFLPQRSGARINELELGKLCVEDADDLGQLRMISMCQYILIVEGHTGSSGLPVLLSVCDVLLISSIISVRSLLRSLSLSDSFSASLYVLSRS